MGGGLGAFLRWGGGTRPGAAIHSSDHSSIRLFSIGVPVSASLNGAASSRTQRYVLAWCFLTY